MHVIRVKGVSQHADTRSEGKKLLKEIEKTILSDDKSIVSISFEGCDVITCSFIEESLIPVAENMSFDDFKKRIKFINSTKQINGLIKRLILGFYKEK